MKLKILKHSLLDAPGSSSVIFFPKCNMACPYCHNVDLWNGNESEDDYTVDAAIDYMGSRIRVGPHGQFLEVDWMTFSGGEPTLQPEVLKDTLKRAKWLGFKTCLYTNGTADKCDELLSDVLRRDLLDAVNLDLKWDLHHPQFGYTEWTRWHTSFMTLKGALDMSKISHLRINTTVMKSYHTSEVMRNIKNLIWRTSYQRYPTIAIRRGSPWEPGFTWSIEPFFNDGGKVKTLGDLAPSESPTQYDLKKILLDLKG